MKKEETRRKLRKTIWPLSSRQVCDWRCLCASVMRAGGLSFRGIRQVMKLNGPDEARRLVAKFKRKQEI